MTGDTLDVECLRHLVEKLPESYGQRDKWTMFLGGEAFKTVARISDDPLVEIIRGCMGIAPPPTAVVVVESPELIGQPGSGLSWCYWRADDD